jgi:hypothetical protein
MRPLYPTGTSASPVSSCEVWGLLSVTCANTANANGKDAAARFLSLRIPFDMPFLEAPVCFPSYESRLFLINSNFPSPTTTIALFPAITSLLMPY